MAYAKRTKVSTDQTRYEIEKTLRRYGAEAFSYGSDDRLGMAVIMFRANNRKIRFTLRIPKTRPTSKPGRSGAPCSCA